MSVTTINHFEDTKRRCYANLTMASGEPCLISVAQSGVLIKRSKVGIFGAILYDEKVIHRCVEMANKLGATYPKQIVPHEMHDPLLTCFVNAVLNCQSCTDVSLMFTKPIC